MQRGRNRPALHTQRRRDRLVVQIRVVAKKEGETLTLGERRDRRPNLTPVLGATVRARGRRRRRRRASPLVRADVDERAPEPAFEASFAAKIEAGSDRAREGLLDGVARLLVVPERRARDAEEPRVAAAVDVL